MDKKEVIQKILKIKPSKHYKSAGYSSYSDEDLLMRIDIMLSVLLGRIEDRENERNKNK